MTHVIGLVGKSGSGKGTIVDIFKEIWKRQLNVPVVRFSDPINDALDAWGLEKNRTNQQKISIAMRGEFGQSVIADAVEQRIKISMRGGGFIMVDGMRRPADVQLVRKFDNDDTVENTIIGVTAPAEVRFERIKKRADRPGDAEKTWEQFQIEQAAETEQLIDGLVANADVVFENNDSIQDLHQKVLEWMKVKYGAFI